MKEDIWQTFNSISKSYDRINRILSFGIDLHWRKTLSNRLPVKNDLKVLDCATGTGDQIFSILQRDLPLQEITGIDLASGMLKIAEEKLSSKKVSIPVHFREASVLSLPFMEDSYDAVTISFGIRNASDTDLALREMHRVLKAGGRALILEFSMPKNPLFQKAYLFYLRHILPLLGKMLSRHASAYRYLNESIETFPKGIEFCKKMEMAGFQNVRHTPLTFGIVTLYEGFR